VCTFIAAFADAVDPGLERPAVGASAFSQTQRLWRFSGPQIAQS
jgi:hypothetical protein